MKKSFIGIAVAFILLSAFAAGPAIMGAGDALETLGITEKQAQETIWKSFEKGTIVFPPGIAARKPGLKEMVFSSRSKLVQELAAFTKQYVSSAEFKAQYEKYRASKAPVAPSKPGEGLNRIESVNRQNLAKAEEGLKNAKPEERKHYEEQIAYWKKQLEPYEDKKSAQYAAQKKNAEGLYDLFSMAHKNKLREFDEKYPADVNDFVKQRLEAFLTMTATVNFEAATKKDSNNKRIVFADPVYESKPYNWKFCYRLGKETIQEARAFAKEWLQELK